MGEDIMMMTALLVVRRTWEELSSLVLSFVFRYILHISRDGMVDTNDLFLPLSSVFIFPSAINVPRKDCYLDIFGQFFFRFPVKDPSAALP